MRPPSPRFVPCPLAAIVASALATVLLSLTAPVHACDCAGPPVQVRPAPSDSSVPANTKIWIGHPGIDKIAACSSPTLKDGNDATVATTLSMLYEPDKKWANVLVLTPQQPLMKGVSYKLVDCDVYGQGGHTTFTVSSGPDEQAPAIPGVTAGEITEGSMGSCGDEFYSTMNVQHDGALLVLDVAGQSALESAVPSGTVNDVFATNGEKIVVGNVICGRHNWDFDEDGDATGVRFGSFDLAGNFSGWSAAQTIETGCGCRLAGAPSGGIGGRLAALFGIVAMLLLHRRRRAKREAH